MALNSLIVLMCHWEITHRLALEFLVADDERPLIRVNALSFFQCFDTAGWLTGRTSGP